MKNKFWIIIFLVALIRFVNLGFENIYPWDEAMYAIRAQSIVKFGNWIDQTPYSVEGLYTSSHPPLFIWLTALGFKFFGVSNITVRLISAILGALLVVAVYFFGKRLLDDRSALFAAIILGLNTLFTHFSRQGQLDIIYTFFVSASLLSYFYYKSIHNKKWLILSGIAFGLALMSKILVGFFVPIILGCYSLYLLITHKEQLSILFSEFVIILGIGIILALPWHIYMYTIHGQNFIDYFFLFHVVKRSISGVEENVRALGPFYFVNQLLVRMPFALTSAVLGIIAAWKEDESKLSFNRFSIFWFLTIFIIISAFKTKLITYLIPALVPLSFLGGFILAEVTSEEVDKKYAFLISFFTLLNITWAADYNLRQNIKLITKSLTKLNLPPLNLFLPPIVAILGILLILFLLSIAHRRFENTGMIKKFLVIIIIIGLVAGCIYYDFIFMANGQDWQILKIKKIFIQKKYEHLIAFGKYRNDQIPYYFDGAGIKNWNSPFDYQRIKKWDGGQTIPQNSLVIVEKFGYDDSVLPYLKTNMNKRLENHRYIVFTN